MIRLLIPLILVFSHPSFSQNGTAKYQEVPENRMGDSLNGIYVPKDLKDCFVELNKHLSATDKQSIKSLESTKAVFEDKRDLGIWIRDKWGLWRGSRLQQYFRDKKINHPDKMSSLIIKFYYDWLKGDNTGWEQWEQRATKYVL